MLLYETRSTEEKRANMTTREIIKNNHKKEADEALALLEALKAQIIAQTNKGNIGSNDVLSARQTKNILKRALKACKK